MRTPVIRLFVQKLVEANNKETYKLHSVVITRFPLQRASNTERFFPVIMSLLYSEVVIQENDPEVVACKVPAFLILEEEVNLCL